MNAKTIRWGIIAPGKIARNFAQDLALVPGASLLGVASRSIDRAEQFAQDFAIPLYFGSYAELAQHPDIDAIYIASPHSAHKAHTLLCLEAGKAVLCEKPFAMNRDEVELMIAKAQEKQCFLMEALWTKFLPSFQKVQDLVLQGSIGQIKSIQADFGFQSVYDPEGRLFNKKLGGGALLDVGIYPLFLCATLLGRPQSIKALAEFMETGVDGQCAMILKYDSGALAQLSASLISDSPIEAFIIGDEGSIHMSTPFFSPQAEVRLLKNREVVASFSPHLNGNGYQYEIEEVVRCLQNQEIESKVMSHEDSLLLMDLLDGVRKEANIHYL